PRKIRKRDEVEKRTTPPDGFIRFEVDHVSTLDLSGKYTDEIEVGGVPWMANVYQFDKADESSVAKEDKWLSVSLICLTNQVKNWRICVEAKYILVHPSNNKHLTIEKSHKFENGDDMRGHDFITWKE
ncbi:hypothetical protein PMAYCL1PPCAC_24873, partial [Pristionchus mayeri]